MAAPLVFAAAHMRSSPQKCQLRRRSLYGLFQKMIVEYLCIKLKFLHFAASIHVLQSCKPIIAFYHEFLIFYFPLRLSNCNTWWNGPYTFIVNLGKIWEKIVKSRKEKLAPQEGEVPIISVARLMNVSGKLRTTPHFQPWGLPFPRADLFHCFQIIWHYFLGRIPRRKRHVFTKEIR